MDLGRQLSGQIDCSKHKDLDLDPQHEKPDLEACAYKPSSGEVEMKICGGRWPASLP